MESRSAVVRLTSIFLLVALCSWRCAADDVAVRHGKRRYPGHLAMSRWVGPNARHERGGTLQHGIGQRPTTYPTVGRKMLQATGCPADNPFDELTVNELATAVLMALETDEVGVVALAVCAGLNPNGFFESTGDSWIIIAVLNEAVDSAAFLIAVGADVNHEATDPVRTALSVAAVLDNAVLVNLLVDNGADLEFAQADGLTPLGLAAAVDSPSAAAALIARDADTEVRDDLGLTPLMRAAFLGSTRTMTVLLEGGADIEATSELGTALHYAALGGQVQAAMILIDAGASLDARDDFGFRPRDVICFVEDEDEPCTPATTDALEMLLA